MDSPSKRLICFCVAGIGTYLATCACLVLMCFAHSKSVARAPLSARAAGGTVQQQSSRVSTSSQAPPSAVEHQLASMDWMHASE